MTYLCGTFFLKCPAGEQCGIHQAKNVVFFQIQVAFSALRHWVSDNRRVFFFFFATDSAKEFLFFLAVEQDVSANTPAFCFSGIAENGEGLVQR